MYLWTFTELYICNLCSYAHNNFFLQMKLKSRYYETIHIFPWAGGLSAYSCLTPSTGPIHAQNYNLSALLRAQMWYFCLGEFPSFTDDEQIGVIKSQKDSYLNESLAHISKVKSRHLSFECSWIPLGVQ